MNQSLSVLQHGEKVFIINLDGLTGENATVGTVRGYAIQSDEDPDQAVASQQAFNAEINNSKRAKYRQQEIRPLTWVTLDDVMISATSQRPITRTVLSVNDPVMVDDLIYRIVPANNHNFSLIPQ